MRLSCSELVLQISASQHPFEKKIWQTQSTSLGEAEMKQKATKIVKHELQQKNEYQRSCSNRIRFKTDLRFSSWI